MLDLIAGRRGFARYRAGSVKLTVASTAIDIDRTLVDKNYQHAFAWYRAAEGPASPRWRSSPAAS